MPPRTEGGLRPAHRPPTTVTRPFFQNADHTPESESRSLIEQQIFQVLWEMRKKGLREPTIKNNARLLSVLSRNADLSDPESIRGFLARFDRNEGYKRNLAIAYGNFAQVHGITWSKPRYREESRIPQIPTDEKINMIIANSPKKLALALSISRDTGLRPVEIVGLRQRDVDFEKSTVYPSTAKHGKGRILTLKPATMSLLSAYCAKLKGQSLDSLIFGKWDSDDYGKWFRYYRNRLAEKLNDPSIRSVKLYSLRHAFATKLYHQTKNLLLVKQQLGHRKIETTLVYTQLIDTNSDDYVCDLGRTVEDCKRLIEEGYEYVTEMDGNKLFKKRK